MELEDIQEVVVGFANSASNMREAGFDGVEVKVGHDGLLRAFASPYLNRRADRYGGSLEGRLRLTIETLRAIREAVGADFVVGARVCLQEYTPWGYDLEYGLAMAAYIEASGLVDYLNCDAGTASSYWAQIPPAAIAEGSFRRLNAELKKRSQLPIISYGRVKHPDMAEAMIAGGEADLIGMARQLIADPQTPRKIAEGRGDDIRFCTASNDSCIFEVLLGKPIRCDHNPAAGREKLLTERHMRRSNDVKTVMVVGGGPAGMKVAETLSRRGHHVMLFEREKEWGGQIALAGRQPYHVDILEITDYLERVLRKQRVEMYLGVSVRPEDIGEMDADAIVLATGSRPRLPRHTTLCAADGNELRADMRDAADLIGSVDEAQVASVDDVLRARIPTPRKAAIIDGSGHWDAAGTAEFLCNQGTEVWIITHRHMAGAALEGANRALFYERIAQKDIHIITSGQVAEVCAGKVTVRDIRTSHATVLSEVDIVVPVVGRVADDELYVALKQHGERRRVYRVGDCVAPRLVRATISEAYEFARQL
jgi:thioredoxin reductase